MKSNKKWLLVTTIILVFTFFAALSAQTQTGERVLTLDDYPRWRHIVSPSISSVGNWISYGLRPNGGDETLYIKSLTTDKIYEIQYGSRPTFSEDSQWAAYLINPPKKEAEKLRKEKKPVPTKAELLNLSNSKKFTVENASSFSFSKDSKFCAIKKAKLDKKAKHSGTDLLLHNLETGLVLNIGNVSDFKFNKPGTMLAYTIDAAEKKGNGIYVIELGTGVQKPLDTGEADYARTEWDKEGTALAVLRGTKKKEFTQKDNTILAFIDLNKGHLTKIKYDPAGDPNFPKNMVISEKAPVSFVNEEDDHPWEKPAYGVAGWTKDGKAVIVNHKFDLWSLPLDGGNPENITGGIGDREQIRFRYINLDPEEKFIDTSKPVLLSAYGEWTKKSGYYSLKIGNEPKKLIYEDKRIGTLIKAKKADKIMYTMETFIDFPDYYVSKIDFKTLKRVTDANPHQKEYAWGRRILIDYKNSNGAKLQATLTLPAGYEKGKKYPVVVYIYEKMSQRHHQYSMPTYDDRPHMSTYASDLNPPSNFFSPQILYSG